MITAYHALLTSDDDSISLKAAQEWSRWENSVNRLYPDPNARARPDSDLRWARYAQWPLRRLTCSEHSPGSSVTTLSMLYVPVVDIADTRHSCRKATLSLRIKSAKCTLLKETLLTLADDTSLVSLSRAAMTYSAR